MKQLLLLLLLTLTTGVPPHTTPSVVELASINHTLETTCIDWYARDDEHIHECSASINIEYIREPVDAVLMVTIADNHTHVDRVTSNDLNSSPLFDAHTDDGTLHHDHDLTYGDRVVIVAVTDTGYTVIDQHTFNCHDVEGWNECAENDTYQPDDASGKTE